MSAFNIKEIDINKIESLQSFIASNNGANADHYQQSQWSYILARQTHLVGPDKNSNSYV